MRVFSLSFVALSLSPRVFSLSLARHASLSLDACLGLSRLLSLLGPLLSLDPSPPSLASRLVEPERRLDSTRSPPALPPPLPLQSTCRRPSCSYTPVPVLTSGAYYSPLGGLSSRSQSCPLVRPARHRALSRRRAARRARRPPSADNPSRSGAATRRSAPIARSCLSRVGFCGRHAGAPRRTFPGRSARRPC